MPYIPLKNKPSIDAMINGFSLHALTFLAQNPEALGEFLAISGTSPQELRQQIKDPAFLAGLMDYFLSQPPLLEAFCAEHKITGQDFVVVRMAFPGADLENLRGI